jgi:hypothetical protein
VTPEPNFQRIRPSRKPLAPGDVFRMKLPDSSYVFGRVILVEPPREQAPTPLANLIYIYQDRSTSGDPDRSRLTPMNLLVPPIYTNRLGWTRGYFETLSNRPLNVEDFVPHHCFRRFDGKYFDENGRQISKLRAGSFCGDWALKSYRAIDDLVSAALGVPLAPE